MCNTIEGGTINPAALSNTKGALLLLKKLGRVLHKTSSGLIVVSTEDIERVPRLNLPVYDEEARRIGVILDVIGPVEKPFIVVKPENREIEIPPGNLLFFREPPKKPKPRKKRQREKHRRKPRRRG